jgi:hypothetical protein
MNETITAEEQVASVRPVRRRLPRNAHHAILTAHIVLAVGLLGDAAGYLAIRSGSWSMSFRTSTRAARIRDSPGPTRNG